MNAKNRIKIVKRAEMDGTGKTAEPQTRDAESQPNAARNVARHVAAWVKEFQQRRVEERRRSFDSLFQRA